MSTSVYLGLGSNQNRERNLVLALDFLDTLLVDLRWSPVYSSGCVGAQGDDFFNLAVMGATDLSIAQLYRAIKRFEARQPRVFKPLLASAIDIDILLFGECVGAYEGGVLPRPDLLQRAYVLRPMAALAPTTVHPTAGLTFDALWRAFAAEPMSAPSPVEVGRFPALSTGLDSRGADRPGDWAMGKQLKLLRTRRGLSLRELAAAAHVTPSSISVIENAQASPAVNTLAKILAGLSITLPEFFAELEKNSVGASRGQEPVTPAYNLG